jgi:alpha-D-xyloside xylohydrolase
MKFTNGFWALRDNITAVFGVELYRYTYTGGTLELLVLPVHQTGRGDILNKPALTVTLSAPLKDVIEVQVTHFKGAKKRWPDFTLIRQPVTAEFTDKENELVFSSGKTTAVISKLPDSWGIQFYYDGKKLTNSGGKCAGYFTDKDTGRSYCADALALDIGEYVYGLGERFTPFVKNGQNVEIWNEDGGTASEQTYKNIPFYLSNKGYGVFVNTPAGVSYEIASEKVERCQFSVEGETLDYLIYGGSSPKDALQKYVASTGYPALPPAWSFGLWLTTSFTTDYSEKIVSTFIDGMKERNIPLSVFHFDCYWMEGMKWCDFIWDKKTFPDPKEMIERYHRKGLKICVWINPYIAQDSYLFDEGIQNGYLVIKENGDVWQTDLWQAGMGLVDFTNPGAVTWYQGKLKKLLDSGVDAFKTDFGERIPVTGIMYHDGSDPVRMHNYYTYLYNKAVFALLEKEKGKGEAALFARSATAGSQQFPIHWGGDCSASYSSMAESLRGGLSLMCSGFGFWSHDISGFESTATPDLYKRWCQFGLLSSHSRLHGSSSYRVPWLFDEEAVDVLRKFTRLKCSLMPYIYSLAAEAHTAGTPVMRPMFMEFPADPACAVLDTQYMFGSALLVAPVFHEDGSVTYYLPHGRWCNLLTHKVYEGGAWYTETYDYLSLPLLVREGAVIVTGKTDDRPDYDYRKEPELILGYFPEGTVSEQKLVSTEGIETVEISVKCSGGSLDVSVSGRTGHITAVSLFNQNVVMHAPSF